jgi:hypothetical protein
VQSAKMTDTAPGFPIGLTPTTHFDGIGVTPKDAVGVGVDCLTVLGPSLVLGMVDALPMTTVKVDRLVIDWTK